MTAPPGEKTCCGCKETKPVSEFGRDVHKKDKRTSRCRACHAQYYRANKEAVAKRQARYYLANRERLLAANKRHRLRRLQSRP